MSVEQYLIFGRVKSPSAGLEMGRLGSEPAGVPVGSGAEQQTPTAAMFRKTGKQLVGKCLYNYPATNKKMFYKTTVDWES